jgi:hypothetical protein
LRSYPDNLVHWQLGGLNVNHQSFMNGQSQMLYVVLVTSILGRLPVVPVGTTGTVPYCMSKELEARDFHGASCDSKEDAGDGCR